MVANYSYYGVSSHRIYFMQHKKDIIRIGYSFLCADDKDIFYFNVTKTLMCGVADLLVPAFVIDSLNFICRERM